MPITFRELHSDNDFDQCLDLQKNLFKLSDTELISPLILKLIARDNPPVGVTLGMFNNDGSNNELIGFISGFASFLEKSIHATIMGIKTGYQNKGYGYQVYLKFREVCLNKNIHFMYGIFDPIESHLANLYFTKLGFSGITYEKEAYSLSNENKKDYIPIDKILVRWEFNSENVIKKINTQKNTLNKNIIDNTPVATINNMPNNPKILVEIPVKFNKIKMTSFSKALEWRMNTRKIFTEYINNRKYLVTDSIRLINNNIKNIYYLLRKD